MLSDSTTSDSDCGSIELSVIVPVYNEEGTLGVVLTGLLSLPIERLEVIVIDDGSTDRTPSIIAEAAIADQRIRPLRLEQNAGKTAAVRHGIEAAQGEIVIIQDADLEYDTAEIPFLIKPLLEGEVDIVYGSRLLGRDSRGNWPFWHFWGNRVITALSNRFTRWTLTDVETCYKAFRSLVLKQFVFNSKGFGIEIEVTALASRTKARFRELPVSYAPRNVSEGKKIRFTDGLWAIYYILIYNALAVWPTYSRKYIQSVNRELDGSLMESCWRRNESSAAIAGRSSDALTTTPAST